LASGARQPGISARLDLVCYQILVLAFDRVLDLGCELVAGCWPQGCFRRVQEQDADHFPLC
jgi:hypothetical protein